jgi:hypothetical protein
MLFVYSTCYQHLVQFINFLSLITSIVCIKLITAAFETKLVLCYYSLFFNTVKRKELKQTALLVRTMRLLAAATVRQAGQEDHTAIKVVFHVLIFTNAVNYIYL